jgi:hypothetical protein
MIYHRIKSRKLRIAAKALTVIGIVMALGMVWFFYELTVMPLAPSEFVKEQTVEESESSLFYTKLVRIPTRGNVTPFILVNRTIPIGIAQQTSELNWGRVPEGVGVVKFLDISNRRERDGKVNIMVYGDIKPYIKVDSGGVFIIRSGTKEEIQLAFESNSSGSYSGEMDVLVRVPKYDFILPFLGMA